jgi:cell division protease FtsH
MPMTDKTVNDADHDRAAALVLRRLALRANGMSGADVERIVREARRNARRQRRSLLWRDLDEILSAYKPLRSDDLRRHVAFHEAGHAVARLVLGLGRLVMITIDGPGGVGFVQSQPSPIAETEEKLAATLIVKLAGRATELIFIGSALAGAGAGEASDLAEATELAAHMELSLGFGAKWPLLHRPVADRSSLLSYNPEIAGRVNARLEAANQRAMNLIEANRSSVEAIAQALLAADTLEGDELDGLIGRLAPRLVPPSPQQEQGADAGKA